MAAEWRNIRHQLLHCSPLRVWDGTNELHINLFTRATLLLCSGTWHVLTTLECVCADLHCVCVPIGEYVLQWCAVCCLVYVVDISLLLSLSLMHSLTSWRFWWSVGWVTLRDRNVMKKERGHSEGWGGDKRHHIPIPHHTPQLTPPTCPHSCDKLTAGKRFMRKPETISYWLC